MKDRALKEFVKKVKERHGDKIEKIILFGSYARGDSTKESDIDVLIVTKDFNLELERNISDISFDILLRYSVDISPKVYSKEEFDKGMKLTTPFMKEIAKYGEVIS